MTKMPGSCPSTLESEMLHSQNKQHVKSIQIDMTKTKILKIVETLVQCFWNGTLYKDNEK